MALIECYECKKSISSEANACIHCGAPMAEQTAHAQAQAVAQIKIERDAMEGVLAHQRGAHARQLTLAQLTEAVEQRDRDHAVEDGIAEELEALVVGLAEAAVRERLLQQARVGKNMPEPGLELVDRHRVSANRCSGAGRTAG